MSTWLSFFISCLAFVTSGVTLWLTFFHRGKLLMTQPTVIFFGPDDGRENKVFLRALIYCSAKKGRVLENLHITLHRDNDKQDFGIWVYGETADLKRGSGLFIPQDGIVFNHHFLLHKKSNNFLFCAGQYKIVVTAKVAGDSLTQELKTINLSIDDNQASQLGSQNNAIYFDLNPDQTTYISHIDLRKNR